MARSSTPNDDAMKWLAIIAGGVLFLPFLLISFVTFGNFKQKYLNNETAQRVMDIKRVIPTAIGAGLILLLALVVVFLCLERPSSSYDSIALLIAAIGILAGVMAARRLAVLYLGVIADKQRDWLAFPYDMQSYTIMDYLSLKFLKEYGEVDTIPLSTISKLTRGRGKELYIHGDFGSRGIIMSSKQKRDECLTAIQRITNKKDLLIAEVENY